MDFRNLNRIRYEAFKTQNHEMGVFDVVFDIGGKKLYANKFMLVPISTTFASMLSDRWISKDHHISIDTYSYDDFYQFITFIYSGECDFTPENISTMVDIAEFYQVSDFKNACGEYLSELEVNLENIVQLLEISTKYSMERLKKSLVPFVTKNRVKILNTELDCQISKDTLLQILKLDQSAGSSEIFFQKVYEWAEKQALSKKESDPNMNLEETIKEILTDFMPLFDFFNMDGHFAIKYLFGKSLLPSNSEWCAALLKSCDQTFPTVLVEITDKNGKVMKGKFSDIENIYAEIQKVKDVECSGGSGRSVYWVTSGLYRPSQNGLKKRSGIDWYLVFDEFSDLAIKHRQEIDESKNYIIAEMFADFHFILSDKRRIDAISF